MLLIKYSFDMKYKDMKKKELNNLMILWKL